MGQTSLNCQVKPTTPRDLLSQQLSIYQWRADPTHNNCIARVFFKNAYTQKQEQKFAEFLQRQEHDNYLEIYKFKEEVQDFRKLSGEEVIVFEKYSCTLADLHSRLRLEDVLYILHSLLLGFEELRKIYERIVVEDSCCFVTAEGEVRAWINPNPKSNQVWGGIQDELPLEVNIRNILSRIVGVAERTAMRSPKGDEFFRISNAMLCKSAFKHCYYADLRRVINEFCYLQNIQMSKNLLEVLRLRDSQSDFRKSYKRELRNTEASENTRDRFIHLPTAQSESYLQTKSLLLKSKSLETHGLPEGRQSAKPMKQSYMRQPEQPKILVHSAGSQVMKHEEPRVSTEVMRQRNSHIQQGKSALKTTTMVCSQDVKKSVLIEEQILEVESVKSSFKQPVGKPQPQQQPIREPIGLIQEPKRVSKTDKSKKGRETLNKNMMVSIMQNLPGNNENCPPSLLRPNTHHKTCMDRHSIEASSQSEMYWSRPWITTKTITKLISENDSSLKNSIAESSDYYNNSVYSGALTHLGRDIAPPNEERTKTVRISRDR